MSASAEIPTDKPLAPALPLAALLILVLQSIKYLW